MLQTLLHELLASTSLVAATVLIHLLGLDALMTLAGLHLRRFTGAWVGLNRLLVPLGIVLGLFALHGMEIWIYALAYRGLGVVTTLEQALYLSTSAYSTLGEAGPTLPAAWRLVGALEAVNGMLLIGWSTAFLFRVLNHLTTPAGGDQPLPRGAIARRKGHGAARGAAPPAPGPDAAPPAGPARTARSGPS